LGIELELRKGFLGMGELSEDEQIQACLLAVFVLTLVSLLEGLVSEAAPRMWIFHGVAVAAAVWALSSGTSRSAQLAGATGIIAVGNEFLLLTDANATIKFLAPSLVLFAVSGFVLRGTFSPSAVRATHSSVRSATERLSSVTQRQIERRLDVKDPSAYLLSVGVILTIYSLAAAKWVTVEAIFGLIKRSYSFGSLRDKYDDLGVKYFAKVFYFEWGYLVGYLAAAIGAILLFGRFTNQFHLRGLLRVCTLTVIAFALVSHTILVVGLNDATEDVLVLFGAWLGSVGLLGLLLGSWLASKE